MHAALASFSLLALSIFGCAPLPGIPLNPTESAKLVGKTMVVASRPLPAFKPITRASAAAAMIPIVGLVLKNQIVESAGAGILQANGITDPAHEIADEIAQMLVQNHRVKYAGIGEKLEGEDGPPAVANFYKDFSLVLDVKTVGWGILYFHGLSDRYRVYYFARLRIVNTVTTAVLVEGRCGTIPRESDDAPTYEELVENGASLLKIELRNHAEGCIAKFSEKYLGFR